MQYDIIIDELTFVIDMQLQYACFFISYARLQVSIRCGGIMYEAYMITTTVNWTYSVMQCT